MKANPWRISIALMVVKFLTPNLGAAETAVAKGDNVNVRGQPSIFSEVLTQLKQGTTVTVLEEITLKKPKPDEPARWARIQMPTNVPVWINASFIELTNSTVKPARLNMRAGPGEKHSVVGLLERGASVKPIRTTDEWMEIQTPTNAYGFVAAEFLSKAPPVATPEPPPPTTTAPAPPPQPSPPAPQPPPPAVEIVKTEPPLAPAQEPPSAKPVEPAPAPTPKPELTSPAPAVAPPPVVPPPVAPPPPKIEEQVPKRIVRREGIVRGTVSVQAPTYYELKSRETGKVLNYLHTTSTNLVLKKFKGKKVVVTGEELMDTRWPSTPVLEVQTLELAP